MVTGKVGRRDTLSLIARSIMARARRIVFFGTFAAMLLLAAGADAVAQITAATITGTVKDETGGVLPGADVVVKNLDTGLARAAVSDTNGLFTISGLLPGRYETRASLTGFATVVERDIVLTVAQQAALNVTLKVSGTAESITVVGAAARRPAAAAVPALASVPGRSRGARRPPHPPAIDRESPSPREGVLRVG